MSSPMWRWRGTSSRFSSTATPATELPFAGHPVLGTAFVLTRARGVDRIELICTAATVALTFDANGRGRMHQPVPSVRPVDNCVAGEGTRWKSRMFGPGIGITEDPATGSAAGPLAAHLCRHGLVPWGTEITISQGTEMGRPSTLYAVARGNDAGVDAVEVAGDTVVVGRGTFDL